MAASKNNNKLHKDSPMYLLNRTAVQAAAATLLLAAAPTGLATPILFGGTDQGASTVNSDAAFAAWQSSVDGFTLDNFDGVSGTPGFGGSLTTSLGNTFSTSDDLLGSQNFSFGVLDGNSMRLTQVGDLTDFVWDIADSVDAFGFFSRNNNGGVVTITFDDGGIQQFMLDAATGGGPGDNLFWGVSGLGMAISSVTITSTDPGTGGTGGNSNWDRFVYQTVAVPTPGVLALLGIGLLGVSLSQFSKRRAS